MSIPSPSRQLFQLFLSTPFDYFFLFFPITHAKHSWGGSGGSNVRIRPRVCFPNLLPFIYRLWLGFGRTPAGMLDFFKTRLNLLFECLFHSSSLIIILKMIWCNGYRGRWPCAGVNLTRAYPFCKHYFSFTGIILCGFPSNFWIDILFLYIVAWLFRSFNWIRHLTILG